MNIDDPFLIIQWFGIFICKERGTSFMMLCETCQGTLIPALSGKPNSGTRPGERTMKVCCFCGVHYVDQSGVRSVDWFLWFCCMFDYFVEGRGEVKGDE